ncbi:MAG: hypothetical protein AAB421_05465 [Patescibacteria group bacterium]
MDRVGRTRAGDYAPHLVSFDSVVGLFTDSAGDVNSRPRTTRVDPSSLSEEGMQKVASAHDPVGGVEYYLYPDKDGLIFGSGSRKSAMPFDPDDKDTLIRPGFPFSLFQSPRKDLERERAHNESTIAIAKRIIEAPWFAHWHPKGSESEAEGDVISIGDLLFALAHKKFNFMFNARGVSMYTSVGNTKQDVAIIATALLAFEKGCVSDRGKDFLKTEEYLGARNNFLKGKIREQGFIYKEFSWGSPTANRVVKMMRGESSGL